LALETKIKKIIPNNERFQKLQNNLEKKLKEASIPSNYWIFQGNPKVFDFETALADDAINNFTVSAHKDKIKIGDKVIVWLSGVKPGCYALAEITSAPKNIQKSKDDKHWKVENNNDLKAGIKVTYNFFHHPILWNDIKNIDELKNLKVGHQGTNFSATENEYKAMLSLAENDKYTWVKTHYQIVNFLKHKKND
jgi:predicted RNA-binding protein with PUA-like domain